MAQQDLTTGPALQGLLDNAALAGEWIFDPSQSAISLRSNSIGGLVRVNGTFRQVAGEGIVSPAGEVRGHITVAAASIDTKNAKRDTHLRSADFFDSDNYPDITFTVDSVRPSGQGVTVTGTLSVRGCSRPMSFDGAAAVQGNGEVWLDAQVPVNRADFGLTWNRLGLVSMDNTITVHARFTRQ
jgi:polyisoprenoid-binding protein YceI